jgi:hypothetical protein
MRGVLAAVFAALTVAGGVVAGGCVIFTGSTDGYTPRDAGGDGAGDGGIASSLECVSAADCGDGGDVCCLVINATTMSAETACQAAPCTGILPAQLCKTSAECGKTGLCQSQTCNLGAVSVTIPACGLVKPCTAQ